MRPVYRITSQKYHNQDSSNLKSVSMVLQRNRSGHYSIHLDREIFTAYWHFTPETELIHLKSTGYLHLSFLPGATWHSYGLIPSAKNIWSYSVLDVDKRDRRREIYAPYRKCQSRLCCDCGITSRELEAHIVFAFHSVKPRDCAGILTWLQPGGIEFSTVEWDLGLITPGKSRPFSSTCLSKSKVDRIDATVSVKVDVEWAMCLPGQSLSIRQWWY